jgi:prepilin signal peptidase PulO-like enzyme (type II secretory pathway)
MHATEALTASGRPEHTRRHLPVAGLGALVALLWVVAFATLGADHALVAALAGSALLGCAWSDLEGGTVPNMIVLPACALVLLARLTLFPGDALEWLLAPLLSASVLALPRIAGRSWLGMGDVKLVLLMGAAAGWGVIAALFLACVLVFPAALVLLLTRGPAGLRTRIPFAPFLALGTIVVLFGPGIAGLPGS